MSRGGRIKPHRSASCHPRPAQVLPLDHSVPLPPAARSRRWGVRVDCTNRGTLDGARGFEMEQVRRLDDELSSMPAVAPSSIPSPSPRSPALQVHKTFVVTVDEQGLVIIDQHALHERVMFELLQRVSEGSLASQRMLVPEIIDAGDAHFEGLEQLEPLLAKLGLDLSPSGPRSISIHAFPSLLIERNVVVGSFVGDLLERAGSGGIPVGDHEEAARRCST